MKFAHRKLRVHKEKITQAINNGSEFKLKEALNVDGKIILKELREHIETEDNILYTIALEEFTEKQLEEIAKCWD